MTRIVGIAGSLRQGSYNAGLLRAAVERMPEGASLDVATIGGIPLYDGDLEKTAYPPAAAALKDAIAGADGLLIVTPEYNNSIPGVLKNAIDWCSRPYTDAPRVFRGRKVGLIGASVTGFGTILSQDAWLPVLRTLQCELWTGGRLMISKADQLFDETGKLTDEKTAGRLADYLEGFAAYVRG